MKNLHLITFLRKLIKDDEYPSEVIKFKLEKAKIASFNRPGLANKIRNIVQ